MRRELLCSGYRVENRQRAPAQCGRRSCAERYLNVRPRGWADTVPICAWLPARAKLAPRAIEGPRARKCVLWHQANLNPPTEMTVRIRKMRACVSCVRVCVWCVVRVVRVVWSAAIRHGTSLVKRVRFYPTRSYRRHQLCTQVGRVCTSVQGRAGGVAGGVAGRRVGRTRGMGEIGGVCGFC